MSSPSLFSTQHDQAQQILDGLSGRESYDEIGVIQPGRSPFRGRGARRAPGPTIADGWAGAHRDIRGPLTVAPCGRLLKGD
ncbi:hypothetical protein D3880_19795 [Pseudomonas cavernae]|uniref:Uncharacterized protein n=1 Tax=Pseudomonas cavernae TaxID=2320867 RepID=A0A385Z5E3_9PSED|nr:hypothetical protein D3880_19795 [Pseudomonas cavernae]